MICRQTWTRHSCFHHFSISDEFFWCTCVCLLLFLVVSKTHGFGFANFDSIENSSAAKEVRARLSHLSRTQTHKRINLFPVGPHLTHHWCFCSLLHSCFLSCAQIFVFCVPLLSLFFSLFLSFSRSLVYGLMRSYVLIGSVVA